MTQALFQATVALANAVANNIAASQSPGAGAILINGSAATAGVATLDVARRVIITSGGNDTAINFTINGTARNGVALSETIAGANAAAAASTQDFLTVTSVTHTGSVATTVTVGTNQVGSSPWFVLNRNVDPTNLGIAVVVSGTINYTVEYTYDDPNAPFQGTFPVVWTTATPAAIKAVAANGDGTITQPITAIRLTVNSFTNPASAKMIVLQAGLSSP